MATTLSAEIPPHPASPLAMCDRLLALAQEAGRAGFAVTAEHLLHLADQVFDEARTAA